jgi:beta-N-acetylhexosaminidase
MSHPRFLRTLVSFLTSLTLLTIGPSCARTPQPGEPAPEVPADSPAEMPPVIADAANPAAPAAPGPVYFPSVTDAHGSRAPRLADLTLREKAAQLVMVWIPGEYWPADGDAMATSLQLAAEEGIGGFVVSIGGSAYDVAAKLNMLQQAAKYPLLIAADLESGPSMRLRGGTALPGNMALGASGREEDAEAAGRIVAREGRAVGFHLNFAPVLDVNNNPANPIINTRSFGEDPSRVAALGRAYIRGLRNGGMLSTAKHFPGHGDTETDSHLALPVITAGRARVDSLELVPFRAAIDEDVDAVMTAHIAMPALTGSDVPATLSGAILDTLLRRELGFQGLVVTDALRMGAIASRYGAARAGVMALQAGADILLMPTNPSETIDAVVRAVERGEVSRGRLDSAVARVLHAKERAGLFRRRVVDLNRIPRIVGDRDHWETARGIAERAMVLVKDTLSLVPLGAERRRSVLVVGYHGESNAGAGAAFAAELRAAGARVRQLRLWPASGTLSYDSVRAAAREASAIIFLVTARPTESRPDAVNMPDSLAFLVRWISSAGLPVIAVSLGSPYLLRQVPEVPAYLVAWAEGELTERAAARALLGLAPVSGRLPVSLPPRARVGDGVMRAVVR